MSKPTNETSELSTGLGLFTSSSMDFATRIKHSEKTHCGEKVSLQVRFPDIQAQTFCPSHGRDRSDSPLNRHEGQTRGMAQWSQFTMEKSTNAPEAGLPPIPTGRE